MSETRNRYGYPTRATPQVDHAALGQEVIIRTVAELRRYLDSLPGDWRVEGPGSDNALLVEAIPGFHADPPLVYFTPIALDAAGMRV
jgi:hypothetical protein